MTVPSSQGGKTLCQNLFYHCFALENEMLGNNLWI